MVLGGSDCGQLVHLQVKRMHGHAVQGAGKPVSDPAHACTSQAFSSIARFGPLGVCAVTRGDSTEHCTCMLQLYTLPQAAHKHKQVHIAYISPPLLPLLPPLPPLPRKEHCMQSTSTEALTSRHRVGGGSAHSRLGSFGCLTLSETV